MDEHLLIVMGTLAGFGALAWYVRTDAAAQARAMERLTIALEKLHDRFDLINAPTRQEHMVLEQEVKRIALRQVEIGTDLANLHHMRRESDGG